MSRPILLLHPDVSGPAGHVTETPARSSRWRHFPGTTGAGYCGGLCS